MQYIFLWFFSILFLISCTQKNGNEKGEVKLGLKEEQGKVDNLEAPCNVEFGYHTKEGCFVNLVFENPNFLLKWGCDDFVKSYPEEFECIVYTDTFDFTPKIISINDKFVVLENITFTPSTGNNNRLTSKIIILPFKEFEKTIEVEGFIKLVGEYAISSNEYDTLIVTNLVSKQEQVVPLSPKPLIVFKTLEYSLDSISLKKRILSFNYISGNHERETIVKKSIKIEI